MTFLEILLTIWAVTSCIFWVIQIKKNNKQEEINHEQDLVNNTIEHRLAELEKPKSRKQTSTK